MRREGGAEGDTSSRSGMSRIGTRKRNGRHKSVLSLAQRRFVVVLFWSTPAAIPRIELENRQPIASRFGTFLV